MQTFFNNRKLKILSAVVIALVTSSSVLSCKAQQPFRFDNYLYKTVYWNEAIKLMKQNSDFLLFDVRTPGEYADTSQYTHMNMGHIKGAVNISIDSFPQHIDELKKFTDKKIFLYCSHSQRSRRVSKLLADNGFKNVYNINGGMSILNESGDKIVPLKNEVLVNGNRYKNIAPADAVTLIQNGDAIIIDVRSREEFNSKDTVFIKNLGHIKNAKNIPAKEFSNTFEGLKIPKEKTLIVYDLNGSVSSDIAADLSKLGYQNVFNLFEGFEGLLTNNNIPPATIKTIVVNPAPINILSVKECINILSNSNQFKIIDARTPDEFNNKAKPEYLNTGRLKGSINIPNLNALANVVNSINKDADILVYGSYSGNNDVDVCKDLVEKGYKNIYFLYQGIGRFTWACFNIENCKDGITLLTNHEGLY
jgi:rhodanese-related sulfurtransferase